MDYYDFLEKLYPKYTCRICGDWYHLPFKECSCDDDDDEDDDE